MRYNKSEYSDGDLFPLRTPMERTVWCTLIERKFSQDATGKKTFPLVCEKGLIAILDQIKFLYINKFPTNMMNTGAVRKGKSTYSQNIKLGWESPIYQDEEKLTDLLNRDNWSITDLWKDTKQLFKLSQLCFTLEDFNKELSLAMSGAGENVIMDEAGFGLSALEWWQHTDLIKEYQVIGKKKIISQFNVPHRENFTHRMRDNAVSIWSDVITLKKGTKVERGYVEIRLADENKWHMDIYWSPFLVCKFASLENDERWIAYEKKKDDFIDYVAKLSEMEKENESIYGKRVDKHLIQRDNLLMEMEQPKIKGKVPYTQTELSKLVGVNQSSISMMITKAFERKEKELMQRAMINEAKKDQVRYLNKGE